MFLTCWLMWTITRFLKPSRRASFLFVNELSLAYPGVTCIHNSYTQRYLAKKTAGLQAVSYRKVLRDDGAGRLDAEVEQIGQWKFLCFSGSFATCLFVYQDKRRGTVCSGKFVIHFTRQSRASRC